MAHNTAYQFYLIHKVKKRAISVLSYSSYFETKYVSQQEVLQFNALIRSSMKQKQFDDFINSNILYENNSLGGQGRQYLEVK